METVALTDSRAVLRAVEAGTQVPCVVCQELVKFNARTRPKQVICNVYTNGVWQQVEHFHEECYNAMDQPYGPPAPDLKFNKSSTINHRKDSTHG